MMDSTLDAGYNDEYKCGVQSDFDAEWRINASVN